MPDSVPTPSSFNIKPDAFGSSVPEEHPIVSEYREWGPKAPPDLFDLTARSMYLCF
ncbi:hypothetical protein ARMGADRAFT_1083539 [Armillaria gallica]|uniref:Uncharacterized protein n=1 Tax=Armillaria gallica TaxID=47427 RepID=A0A2H3DFC2_ARMGA|nr:hypothetical protein ARMGADRAFT_1083539 [Armillaria gallica]